MYQGHQATWINPDYPIGYNNLRLAGSEVGDNQEVMEDYTQLLFHPDYTEADIVLDCDSGLEKKSGSIVSYT